MWAAHSLHFKYKFQIEIGAIAVYYLRIQVLGPYMYIYDTYRLVVGQRKSLDSDSSSRPASTVENVRVFWESIRTSDYS